MTEEQIALARRAVACKGFRWMPGMLTTCDLRVVDGGDEYVIGHRSGPTKDGGGWYDGEAAGLLPDLTDPATLGCLLALVREAWGNPLVGVRGWLDDEGGDDLYEYYEVMGLDDELTADTEAEALVAALEDAP